MSHLGSQAPNDECKTAIATTDPEDGQTDSYRPVRWRSNIAILSCVGRSPLLGSMTISICVLTET